MLVDQFSHKSSQKNVKSLEELCSWIDAHIDQQINWIDLINVSGLDHLTLQSEFAKQKLMTPFAPCSGCSAHPQPVRSARANPAAPTTTRPSLFSWRRSRAYLYCFAC